MGNSVIESRKKDHVDFVVREGAQYSKSSGFDQYDFVHNSLPELAFDKINLSMKFFGKKLSAPMIITGMTGGYASAERINHDLASVAQKYGIAFGLGSQRAMIETPSLLKTFKVRDVAPDIPIIGNIGGVQLVKYGLDVVEKMLSVVDADALAIHLNPLQEIIQPEGDKDYRGVLKAIELVSEKLSLPVIVKETGAGIGTPVVERLHSAGVEWVDVSGSGGTSWSKVEYARSKNTNTVQGFDDWGNPTVECILECRDRFKIIASGGIRDGIAGAKAIAFGARMYGAAYPFIKAATESETRLDEVLSLFIKQTKICAYLTGSSDYEELRKAKLRMLA